MPLQEFQALGAKHLVKRTKVLYLSIALMLFGALGMGVQASESASAVDSVAPALTDACKDYNFRAGHVSACGAANQITAVPTPTNGLVPVAPGVTVVVADQTALALSVPTSK